MSDDTARLLGTLASGRDIGQHQRCPVCKTWGFSGVHECKKLWDAILVGYHEEDAPASARGDDAEAAALSFAEEHFSDFDYVTELEIWVRPAFDEDLEWKKFDITVESVPSFSAEPKP